MMNSDHRIVDVRSTGKIAGAGKKRPFDPKNPMVKLQTKGGKSPLHENVRFECHDLSFICADGKEVPAHKIIMTLASKYFVKLFQDQGGHSTVVFIPDIKYNTMMAVWLLVYDGVVQLPADRLKDLYEALELFEISSSLLKQFNCSTGESKTAVQERANSASTSKQCSTSHLPVKKSRIIESTPIATIAPIKSTSVNEAQTVGTCKDLLVCNDEEHKTIAVMNTANKGLMNRTSPASSMTTEFHGNQVKIPTVKSKVEVQKKKDKPLELKEKTSQHTDEASHRKQEQPIAPNLQENKAKKSAALPLPNTLEAKVAKLESVLAAQLTAPMSSVTFPKRFTIFNMGKAEKGNTKTKLKTPECRLKSIPSLKSTSEQLKDNLNLSALRIVDELQPSTSASLRAALPVVLSSAEKTPLLTSAGKDDKIKLNIASQRSLTQDTNKPKLEHCVQTTRNDTDINSAVNATRKTGVSKAVKPNGLNTWTCLVCKTLFITEEMCKKHMKTNISTCGNSDMVFENINQVVDHEQKKHGKFSSPLNSSGFKREQSKVGIGKSTISVPKKMEKLPNGERTVPNLTQLKTGNTSDSTPKDKIAETKAGHDYGLRSKM